MKLNNEMLTPVAEADSSQATRMGAVVTSYVHKTPYCLSRSNKIM